LGFSASLPKSGLSRFWLLSLLSCLQDLERGDLYDPETKNQAASFANEAALLLVFFEIKLVDGKFSKRVHRVDRFAHKRRDHRLAKC
jgi:hypothetical protein